MYPRMSLGKFLIPSTPDGPLRATYQPEPLPIVVKGSMNPWADAQATSLRNQEDAAWKVLQPLIARAAQTWGQLQQEAAYFNGKLQELSDTLGHRVGGELNLTVPTMPGIPLPSVKPITSSGQLVMDIVFPPFLLPGFDIVGKFLGSLLGFDNKAKKKAAHAKFLVNLLQESQARIQSLLSAFGPQMKAVIDQEQTALGIRAALQQVAATAITTATAQADQRAAADYQAGLDLAARNAQNALLYPRTPGGYSNAL